MQALVARCAALIALILVVTSSSSAFSSLAGGTHRLILEAAYRAVAPYVARGVPFPSIEEIGRFEGITAYKTEKPPVVFREGEAAEIRLATTGRGGPGPDATTDYSWHYYNPRTGDGLAPAKVGDYFSVLADALGRGTKDPKTPPAKAAAYLAHFLADLSVPYHVNGTSRNLDALAAHEHARERISQPGTPEFDPEMVGPIDQLRQSTFEPAGGWTHTWAAAIDRWRASKPRPDWFDPWYWDADSEVTGTHGTWEAQESLIPQSLQLAVQALNEPAPGGGAASPLGVLLEGPRVTVERVRRFAESRAAQTNGNLKALVDAPQRGVVQAVADVALVWRASISAIRPASVSAERLPGTNTVKLNAIIANAEMSEGARNIAVQILDVQRGRLVAGGEQRLPALGAGQRQMLTDVARVDSSAGSVLVRIQVSAEFSTTPDAGLAEREFEVPIPPLVPPPPMRRSVRDVMTAALRQLGYTWKEAELPSMSGPPPGAGGYLQCSEAGCGYVLVFPADRGQNQAGKVALDFLEIVAVAAGTPEGAQQVFRDELKKDNLKPGTYRGLTSGSIEEDSSAGNANEGWGWFSRRKLVAYGEDVVISLTRITSCATLAETNICGGLRVVTMPTREADAIIEEAVLGGLIPTRTVK